jgi:large subunit ribosomal protein L25
LPKDLPEFIEVDVSALDIGEGLHLSDLSLPVGVSLLALSHGESGDLGVVTVVPPKVEQTETPEAG